MCLNFLAYSSGYCEDTNPTRKRGVPAAKLRHYPLPTIETSHLSRKYPRPNSFGLHSILTASSKLLPADCLAFEYFSHPVCEFFGRTPSYNVV
jgi:hypothetical protein